MRLGLFWACFGLLALCLAGEVRLPVEGSTDTGQDDLSKKSVVKRDIKIRYELDARGNKQQMDFSLELKSISDPDLLYSHFAHRKVVIYYFSVKCRHCLKVFHNIKQLAEDLEQKEVSMIAVAVMNSKEDDIRNFIRKNDINFPVFHDNAKKFSTLYGTGGIPLVVVVNQYGAFLKYEQFDEDKTPDQIIELYSDTDFAR